MKLLDRIAKRLGYTSIKRCERDLKIVRSDYEREYKKLESLQLDHLIDAIRTVNMIKLHFEGPISVRWFENFDPSQPVRVEHLEDYPPNSKWYQYRVSIDVAKMQRIYEELKMSQNSYELEYLKKSIWHHIEQNLDALIKLELGVR